MLIGRDKARREVDELLDDDRAAVIVGPPGIGKTSLASELVDDRPTATVQGYASLRTVPGAAFTPLVGRLSSGDPDAAASVVARALDGRMLIVDDAPWVDDLSAAVVERLARLGPLVATARTGEALPTGIDWHVVELHPLSADDADALARRLHPHLSGEERAGLCRAAEGNPLLLHQLVDEAPSPALASALAARAGRLGPAARRSMELLVVAGHPLPEAGLEAVEELVELNLAERTDHDLRLRHALLGEVFADGLSESERVVHHRRLAELVNDPLDAVRHELAGGRAAAARRRADAIALTVGLQRGPALALAAEASDGEDAVRLRVEAARAMNASGLHRAVIDLVGDHCLLDPQLDADRAVELGTAHWNLGESETGLAVLEAGLGRVRGTGTAGESKLLALGTIADTYLRLDGRPALERAEAALAIAQRVGEAELTARWRLGACLLTTGQAGWEEHYRWVIREAMVDDGTARSDAARSLVLALWMSGDLASALEVAEAEQQRARADGLESVWPILLSYAFCIALSLPDADRPAVLERARPLLVERPFFRHRPFAVCAATIGYADTGRVHEAMTLLAKPNHLGESQQDAMLDWATAELAWATADVDGAMAAGASAVERGLGDHPAVVMARLLGGHAAAWAGHSPAGPPINAVFPTVAGAPDEWAGLTEVAAEDWPAAVRAFDAAATAWERGNARSAGRCRLAAADAALAAGATDAVGRLREVERSAEAESWHSLARMARRSLRRAGVRSATPAGEGVGPLSARETEVMELAAAGLTTARIAAVLGVADATVDSQVMAARRKLGARSRVEAVAKLADLRAATADAS